VAWRSRREGEKGKEGDLRLVRSQVVDFLRGSVIHIVQKDTGNPSVTLSGRVSKYAVILSRQQIKKSTWSESISVTRRKGRSRR
jgi:hypothetical protein